MDKIYEIQLYLYACWVDLAKLQKYLATKKNHAEAFKGIRI